MSKKERIRWKEAIGSKNENITQKGISGVGDLLLSLFCALLFLISVRTMSEDVYIWTSYSAGSIAFAGFLMLLVGIVMESSNYVNKKLGTGIRWGVLVFGICAFVWYWFVGDNGEHIRQGLMEALRLYIIDWNKYYGAYIDVLPGNIMYIEEALDFVFLCLSLVFFWLAMATKKNSVMARVPLFIFILQLLVGFSPDEKGIILAFVGVLLSNAAKWKNPELKKLLEKKSTVYGVLKNFTWTIVGMCVLLTYGLVKLVGSSSAEELAGKGEQFKQWQEEIVESIKNLSLFDGGIGDDGTFDGILNGNWGNTDPTTDKLTNDKPNYTGKNILSMRMEYRPEDSIYLKGFYANEYNDGEWKLDTESFVYACNEAGYLVSDISEYIATLGIDKVKLSNGVYMIDDLPTASTATITYFNASGRRAFYPYFMEAAIGEGTRVSGEGRYTKDKNVTKVFFDMWEYDPLYETKLSMFENLTKYDWEEWYEDYVMASYLEVPELMPNVSQVASEIEKSNPTDGVYGINNKRMAYAYAVANWMEKNTRYNLELPELPDGVDPVEYFLGNTKTGYCMHFASASTLILRELGVPARFATGYIVNPSLFVKKTGEYVANIPDDRAHAWVEIYLEGIGWVPIEVTKGYDSTEITTTEKPSDENQTKDPAEDETTTNQEQTSENQTSSESTSEDITKPGMTTSSQHDASTEETGDGSGGSNGSGTGTGISAGTLKLVLILIAIASIVAIIVCVIMGTKANYNNKLLRTIEKKRTRRAIKTINRRIFRKLRLKGKILKSNPTDEDYETALKKTYAEISPEDWNRYMDIVKAVAFSKREFSVEEMNFCFDIYNNIRKKK